MARTHGPQFAHRPKDYVTMEQATELARLAAREELRRVLSAHLEKHHTPWYKRVWRRVRRVR